MIALPSSPGESSILGPRSGHFYNDSYYGQYRMLLPVKQGFLIAIGPHWYVSLFGFALILFVAAGLLYPLYPIFTPTILAIYTLVSGSVLAIYLMMIFSDPGIVPAPRSASILMDKEEGTAFTCKRCLTPKEARAIHCEDCDICIEGLDHHCIWVGKCVGKKNLRLFYVFVGSVPLFMVFVMGVACLVAGQQ